MAGKLRDTGWEAFPFPGSTRRASLNAGPAAVPGSLWTDAWDGSAGISNAAFLRGHIRGSGGRWRPEITVEPQDHDTRETLASVRSRPHPDSARALGLRPPATDAVPAPHPGELATRPGARPR